MYRVLCLAIQFTYISNKCLRIETRNTDGSKEIKSDFTCEKSIVMKEV